MAEITGGELLARCLAAEGVRLVFGLPCPEVDPLLAALEGNGLRFVPIRHEAAGAHMAEGLYKTTGQVAAVLGNPGPGSRRTCCPGSSLRATRGFRSWRSPPSTGSGSSIPRRRPRSRARTSSRSSAPA